MEEKVMIHHLTTWRVAALIGCVLVANACTSTRTAACVRITPIEAEPLVVQETVAVVVGLAQSRLDRGSGRMPGRIEFEEAPLEDVLKYLQLEVPWKLRIHRAVLLTASVSLSQGRDLELNTIADVLNFMCESVSLRWQPGPNCVFIERLTGETDDVDLTLTYNLTDEGELDREFRIYLDKELQRAFFKHGVRPTKLEFSRGRIIVGARPTCHLIVRQTVASCLALRNAAPAKHPAANYGHPVSAPVETPHFEEGVWRYLLLQRKDLRQSNFPMHFSEEPLDLIANTLVNDLDLRVSIHNSIGNVVISEFAADDSLFKSIEKLVGMAGGSWHLGAKTIFVDAANGVSNDPLIRRTYHQSRAVDSGTGRFSSIALEAWLASSVPGLGFVSCEWTPDGSLLVTTYELSHGRICCPLSSLGLRVH